MPQLARKDGDIQRRCHYTMHGRRRGQENELRGAGSVKRGCGAEPREGHTVAQAILELPMANTTWPRLRAWPLFESRKVGLF